MFSFGSKLKSKLAATRFFFSFVIHNLQPWPSGNRAIAVGYQRGKRRRGATRSVFPSTAPGRLGCVVRFNERFEIPVTLYKTAGNANNASGLGPFKKKCLILAVLETDGRTQATAALGRVVIDLSEFAAVEHQETRTFLVSCNKQIHAAVGEPQLMVTVRCRWKKTANTGGNGLNLPDETGSMSTDTTGSRMTANLSSFLRFKFTGKGPVNDEQDLQGFDSRNLLTPASSVPTDKYMHTIQEGQDEPLSHQRLGPGARSPNMTPSSSSRQFTPTSSGANGGSVLQSASPPYGAHAHSGSGGRSPGVVSVAEEAAYREADAVARGIEGMSLREQYAYGQQQVQTVHGGTGVPPATLAAAAAGLHGDSAMGTPQSSFGGGKMPPGMEGAAGAAGAAPVYGVPGQEAALRSRRSLMSLPSNISTDAEALLALRTELLTCAALDAAINLARPVAAGTGLGGSRASSAVLAASSISTLAAAGGGGPGALAAAAAARGVHAPARRLARTLVCKGQGGDGVSFGNCALRVLRAVVEASDDGLGTLAYWWSNVVHLRALLQGLAGGSGGSGITPVILGAGNINAGWAAATFVPQLSILEREIFEKVLTRLWEGVLLPTVTGGAARGATPAKAVPVTKRAMQEAAIKRWFEGLEAVAGALSRIASYGGHAGLLRQQVLVQCLKKLDALMFYYLLGGEQRPDILSDYDPLGMLWGPGRAPPALDDASLPFSKGVLTFGGGMGVKMTVTRLQQWAASENALGEAASAPVGGGGSNGSAAGASGGIGGAPDSPTPPVAAAVPAGAVGVGPLFPLLRAAADLLMMPKDLLLDRAIRIDVCSALSMRSVMHILEQFQPDEFAQDTISESILDSLREDSAVPLTMKSPAAETGAGYRAPPDAAVLSGVEAGAEPGLEYEAESEDELETMAQMTAGAVGTSASRFRLLHDLWVSGVPRSSSRRHAAAAGVQ